MPTRRFGELLSGRRQLDVGLLRRLPMQPQVKRVPRAVAAKRYPDNARTF